MSGGSLAGSQCGLAGKVAIVTAATDGIGLAAAQALGQRGAHVVVSSRRQSNVDKAVALLQSEKIQVTGTTCNVGNSEDRARLVNMTVEQCGGVDIFVSNAAVNPFFGNIMDSTEAVWDKILDVNVKSAFLMTQLVVPHLEKRGGGSVVFVSSVAGYQPMQALGPYSVSKTALLGLTRALAPELAQSHIRVNCVAPGVIKTPFSQALWQDEDVVDEFKKQLSIKRFGKPEEIGGVIAFLCSRDASYIIGETITVTGGMSCRLRLIAWKVLIESVNADCDTQRKQCFSNIMDCKTGRFTIHFSHVFLSKSNDFRTRSQEVMGKWTVDTTDILSGCFSVGTIQCSELTNKRHVFYYTFKRSITAH